MTAQKAHHFLHFQILSAYLPVAPKISCFSSANRRKYKKILQSLWNFQENMVQ
jgi:hypothetical protein